jgi:mono/diheme cytochrome c family protein
LPNDRVIPENRLPSQSQKESWVLIVFVLCWGLTGWPGSETAWSQKTEVIQGGKHLFEKFCVTCHGQGAKGDGPLADSFSPPPADLTTLTKRNGGTFPFWWAYSIIDGRQHLSAHGTRDMPVFGIWFRIPDDEISIESEWADQVRGRIWQLLSFLESIQTS